MGRLHTWLWVGTLWTMGALAQQAPQHLSPEVPVRFVHEREAFEAWSFDTGWLPAPAPDVTAPPPIQVRIEGHLGGGLEASAQGALHLGWEPWQVTASGEPEGGSLVMNLGVELAVSLRIDITLPDGSPFFWEGPMPGNPGFDYRFAAEQSFPPFLLEGATVESVLVTDTIQRTRLLELPITPAMISLPFFEVSGSVDVDAGGVLDVVLERGRLTFPEGVLAQVAQPLIVTAPPGDGYQTQVAYEANAIYAALLELVPQVTLHVGPLDFTLASLTVPVPLEPIEETWAFDEGASQPVAFTLPRLGVQVDGAETGTDAIVFAGGEARTILLYNSGAAPLTVNLSLSGTGFTVLPPGPVTVAPGASEERQLIAGLSAGPQTATLTIDSNDPSGARTLTLHSEAAAMGCTAAPGSALGFVALLLLGLRRRR